MDHQDSFCSRGNTHCLLQRRAFTAARKAYTTTKIGATTSFWQHYKKCESRRMTKEAAYEQQNLVPSKIFTLLHHMRTANCVCKRVLCEG